MKLIIEFGDQKFEIDEPSSIICGNTPAWKEAPIWAKYWAIDNTGIAHWFRYEPVNFYGKWIIPALKYRKTYPEKSFAGISIIFFEEEKTIKINCENYLYSLQEKYTQQ